MQNAVLPEDFLLQLHQQRHGVHVVQQHQALRGLQRVHHLVPVRAVSGVADRHLLPWVFVCSEPQPRSLSMVDRAMERWTELKEMRVNSVMVCFDPQ